MILKVNECCLNAQMGRQFSRGRLKYKTLLFVCIGTTSKTSLAHQQRKAPTMFSYLVSRIRNQFHRRFGKYCVFFSQIKASLMVLIKTPGG